MGLALNDDGTILFNATTGLSLQRTGQTLLEQDARSECRCEQGTYFADEFYGRSPFAWKLSPRDSDRVADVKRIVTKYYEPSSIYVDENRRIVVESVLG
jgi:hypothetical protein